MESRAKFLGHAAHQMLIPFPLGLLVTGATCDLVNVGLRRRGLSKLSYWNVATGLALTPVAAAFGAVDWLAIPSGTRAKRVGALHGVGNVAMAALFGASLLLRKNAPGRRPGGAAIALEAAALALGGVTAWLGGELVDRLGVGVDEGAHLDAPSSLSREPASAEASPLAA
jgi:uncharacterized membrane protein